MKKFEAPVLEVIEDFAMEPVYALSGTPDTPDTPDKPEGDWDIETSWPAHNTGHHSELHISAKNNGNLSGEGITMTFCTQGFKLATVKDSSGYPVSNVHEGGFTLFRPGHFNQGESIGFTIQITASDSPYEGSVAKTGQVCPHKVLCTSYITC